MNTIKPASPLPWRKTQVFKGDDGIIAARYDLIMTDCDMEDENYTCLLRTMDNLPEADAAYIVHACNHYPALVEALQKIVDIKASTGGPESLIDGFKEIASVALSPQLTPNERHTHDKRKDTHRNIFPRRQ